MDYTDLIKKLDNPMDVLVKIRFTDEDTEKRDPIPVTVGTMSVGDVKSKLMDEFKVAETGDTVSSQRHLGWAIFMRNAILNVKHFFESELKYQVNKIRMKMECRIRQLEGQIRGLESLNGVLEANNKALELDIAAHKKHDKERESYISSLKLMLPAELLFDPEIFREIQPRDLGDQVPANNIQQPAAAIGERMEVEGLE